LLPPTTIGPAGIITVAPLARAEFRLAAADHVPADGV
jgi:hypothetical protein